MSTTTPLLAKLAAAADLIRHAEHDAEIDSLQTLRDLHLLTQTIKSATRNAVADARAAGHAWAAVGEALDQSAQAAHKRWSPQV
jgi:hypothetical protein